LLGKWFAANPGKREDIFLATKFGIRIIDGKLNPNSSPEYCRQAIEKSLKRLGLPYIDLYYIHRLDKVTPIEKTIQAMVELKNEGKIRHLGVSECSAESLRRAHAVHPITAIQVEYSLFCREIESPQTKLLETARELGVGVVCYSPLGNGFLTGRYRTVEDVSGPGDRRHILPWYAPDNLSKNLLVLDKIAEVARAKGITSAQLALAWLLAQGDDIFPIPGTSNPNRLNENLSSALVTITAEEEKALRQLASEVIGERFQNKTGFAYGDTPPLE
jgi:aryl-alcohol dehydrogenase-like predicted oxidoreductase